MQAPGGPILAPAGPLPAGAQGPGLRQPATTPGIGSISIGVALGASPRGNSSCFPSRLVVWVPAIRGETQTWSPKREPRQGQHLEAVFNRTAPASHRWGESEEGRAPHPDVSLSACSAPSSLPGSAGLCSLARFPLLLLPAAVPPRASRAPTARQRQRQQSVPCKRRFLKAVPWSEVAQERGRSHGEAGNTGLSSASPPPGWGPRRCRDSRPQRAWSAAVRRHRLLRPRQRCFGRGCSHLRTRANAIPSPSFKISEELRN